MSHSASIRREFRSEGVGGCGLDHGNRNLILIAAIVDSHVMITGKLVAALVKAIVVLTIFFIFIGDCRQHFDFTAENHGEAFSANRFLDKGEVGAAPPFVKLTSKSIGLEFQKPKFARSEKSVSARGLNMCDRGIDD